MSGSELRSCQQLGSDLAFHTTARWPDWKAIRPNFFSSYSSSLLFYRCIFHTYYPHLCRFPPSFYDNHTFQCCKTVNMSANIKLFRGFLHKIPRCLLKCAAFVLGFNIYLVDLNKNKTNSLHWKSNPIQFTSFTCMKFAQTHKLIIIS